MHMTNSSDIPFVRVHIDLNINIQIEIKCACLQEAFLAQGTESSANVSKALAFKDTISLIAHCMCTAQRTPANAKRSKEILALQACLVHWQGIGARFKDELA